MSDLHEARDTTAITATKRSFDMTSFIACSNRAVEPTKYLCHLATSLNRPPSCSPKTADRVSKLSELLPRGVSVPARSWQPKLRAN